MAKPLGFKDFLSVDYTQTSDGQLDRQAKKRKTDLDRGLNDETQDEALDMSQRRARARTMKRVKAKIALGRKRAEKRTASPEKLKQRARKQAIRQVFNKLAKGKSKDEVSFARRQEIEKRIEKMGNRVDRIAKKLLPKVRKLERERKQSKSSSSENK